MIQKQSELNFCLSPSPDRQQRQQRFPRPIIDESARAYYQPSADSETSADDLAVNRVEYGVDIVAKPKPRRTSIDRQVLQYYFLTKFVAAIISNKILQV